MIINIKNLTASPVTWVGQTIQPGDTYQIQPLQYNVWANDSPLLQMIANGSAIVNNGTTDITDVNSAINYLKNNVPQAVSITSTVPANPFAQPTYRTKIDACDQIYVANPGETVNIDFKLPQTRFLYGGELIVTNGQHGDYFSSCIYDKDGIIPVPYRVVAENYPTLATYIIKQYPQITAAASIIKLDTRPLSAEVSQGLYVRSTYVATSDGVPRNIVMNYYTCINVGS